MRSNYLSTFYIYLNFDLIIYNRYNLNLFYLLKDLRIFFLKLIFLEINYYYYYYFYF